MASKQLITKGYKNVCASFTLISRNLQDASSYKYMPNITKSLPRAELSSVLLNKLCIWKQNDNQSHPNGIPFIVTQSLHNIIEEKYAPGHLTDILQKKMYMPSIAVNHVKVYQDSPANVLKIISDPLVQKYEIIDAPVVGRPTMKEAVRMILIRRRKMRKHKLRKLRKKMKFVFAKIKMRKELRIEQAFRKELLIQVEEAESFNAKQHVNDILHTLRYYPRPETIEECRERYRLIRKKNRSNTSFIRPSFED